MHNIPLFSYALCPHIYTVASVTLILIILVDISIHICIYFEYGVINTSRLKSHVFTIFIKKWEDQNRIELTAQFLFQFLRKIDVSLIVEIR